MPAASGSASSGEEGFQQLKQAIIARTGHHYYMDKDNLLRERLERRLSATGCPTLGEYIGLLRHPARGAAEWEELEAEITIGETFFFRHAEQFAALRDVILPELILHNAGRRALRIWSAGCAVGAEPYSIAILLERQLGQAMRDWTVDIVGSDINRHALAQAREGLFTDWALRGMPAAERAQDFMPMSNRRHWRIADRHRRRVRFVQHNLLSLPPEGRSADWSAFDLILCRNVLIYFSADRIAPTLSALAHCLAPHGWLMVGHSDAIAALPRGLRVIELAGTMAFRPPTAAPTAPAATSAAPAVAALPTAPAQDAALDALDRRPADVAGLCRSVPRAPPASVATAPSPKVRAAVPLAVIRALADAGRLMEAAEACAAAIATNPLDARLHFYDGVIAQAAGRPRDAEAALRRAVYLSGDMVMAHYHLGLLLLDGPGKAAGRRSMAEVIKLCNSLPDDARVPESDGLTPGEVVERVRLRLRARPD